MAKEIKKPKRDLEIIRMESLMKSIDEVGRKMHAFQRDFGVTALPRVIRYVHSRERWIFDWIERMKNQ